MKIKVQHINTYGVQQKQCLEKTQSFKLQEQKRKSFKSVMQVFTLRHQKRKQIKPEESRRKEIIKSKLETNEIQNRKTIEYNETKKDKDVNLTEIKCRT